MATCQVVSEMELNPLTRNYMAIAHTRVEGLGFAIKVVVTIASVTIASSTKWLSLVNLFFFALLFYLSVKWVPFIYSALNYVRCASYATVLYCSVLLAVLAFGTPGLEDQASGFRNRMTWALFTGMAPAAVAGALACHLRLLHFRKNVQSRFRDTDPSAGSKSIYRFSDAREVEIAARCCRRWVDEDTLEPEAVALSEAIIKAGMLQLPQDPREDGFQMIILYSSFLIDVQGSYQSGYTQLQTAKKQSPGLLERFAIFSREQEHAQKASGANNGGGDSAVDLVSYVEFQRNHRLVVRAHREALLAMRSFWALLLRTKVDFNHLSKALHRIEVTVKSAERAYRGVLARHGSSARLLRLYGRFLETVKFDPWSASKWYSEADRLDEEAEHAKEALQLGGMETLLPQGASAERGLAEMEGVAFICINAQGVIQVASPEAHSLLGYGKNELKGKDVGLIMPPPFGDRHAAYVRNHIETGRAFLLDRITEVVVLSKTKKVIPVKLRITKVSGLNEDSVFLGVLEPVTPPPNEARAWVLSSGVIVAADDRFCDWLGYELSALAGTELDSLLLEPDIVMRVHGPLKEGKLGGPGAVHGEKHAPAVTATGESSSAKSVVHLVRAAWRHKYIPEPLEFETVLQPGAFGSVKVHSVLLHRSSPPEEYSLPPGPPEAGLGLGHVSYAPESYGSKGQDLAAFAPRGGFQCADMLLVTDVKGRVRHVTASLAAALGRSAEAIRLGGMAMLIPEPANILHGPWLQELGNPQSAGSTDPPPPLSCRRGVAVSLCTHSEEQGPGTRPFRLSVSHRLAEGGGSKIHVVSLVPITTEQALCERRLVLNVDLAGTILSADDNTAPELFGTRPQALVGRSVAQIIDVFRPDAHDQELLGPEAAAALSPNGAPLRLSPSATEALLGVPGEGTDVLEGTAMIAQAAFARRLTKALLELARRSSETPGCSWRVGVHVPPDEAARQELEQLAALLGPSDAELAAHFLGAKTVPAVMRVRLAVRRTGPSGSAFLMLRPSAPSVAQPGFLRWLYDDDASCLMAPEFCGGRRQDLLVPAVAVASIPGAGASGLHLVSPGGAGDTALLMSHAHSGEQPPHGLLLGSAAAEAAGGDAAAYAPRRAYTITGVNSMAMVDRSAAAAGSPYTHHSVTGIGAIDARGPGKKQPPALAGLLTPSVKPPQQPQAQAQPVLQAGVSAVRISALRGATANNGNGPQTPSRLSVATAPTAPGPARAISPMIATGEPDGFFQKITGQLSGLSDMAYEQSVRPAGQSVAAIPEDEAVIGDAGGLEPLPTKASPLPGSHGIVRARGEINPRSLQPQLSKLDAKRHNMVHNWVLHGQGPGANPQDPPQLPHVPDPPPTQGSPGDLSREGSDGSRAGELTEDGTPAGGGGGVDGRGQTAERRTTGSGSGGGEGATDTEMESEAGALVANYSVGKRFKKLHKMLTSPVAEKSALQLRWHAMGVVAALLAAHTATFVLLLTQLLTQQADVEDLNSVAMASRRVHEISINGRMLDRLYSGNSYVEGIPNFGESLNASIADIYDDLDFLADSMKEIWDLPNLNVTVYYDANDPSDPSKIASSGALPPPTTVLMGLWDLGNLFVSKAYDLHNNGPYTVQKGANYTNWSTWRFIRDNGLTVVFPAYQVTLDALVQLTVAKSRTIYKIQLIVLCLEGGLLCMLACAYIWYVANKFSQRRHKLYNVFVQIPLGVTRGLANMSLKLEATEEDEEEEHMQAVQDQITREAPGGLDGNFLTDGAIKAAASGPSHNNVLQFEQPSIRQRKRSGNINFGFQGLSGRPGEDDDADAPTREASGTADGAHGSRSWITLNVFDALAFWRGRAKVSPHQQAKAAGRTKRRLVPSQRLAYSLVLPFILWGLIIIIINLVGCNTLEAMTAPIATLNLVNSVLVRAHRLFFYVLEVAAAHSVEACTFFKTVLNAELKDFHLEYATMLYGNEAAPDSVIPHYRLAETGVVFGGFKRPAHVLYKTRDCLCNNVEICAAPDHYIYEVTRNGLDVLLKMQSSYIESLILQPPEASGMNSTEFRAIWSTAQTDVECGVTMMSNVFLDEVQGSYRQVLVQQVIMFSIAWVWGLAFLVLQLRPLLRKSHNEMRRIAELLSQLPGEVDCEALVTAVILGEQGTATHAAGLGKYSMSGFGGASGNGGSPSGAGGTSSKLGGKLPSV
ncbi:hypothetical protein GPECTOR_2g1216 [Gonium pectorale]|uniref:PAS domain-containing protein n=1 Tax=Gonium pectorale TaxID=33097 RepID=A0A150H0H0_GONPE|nr:hypothetical protein GPECTOR_2g1216 [Gonium pectorale]|eukprot:KXZ55666.1 hypothetical protein GPECTOR_2g1216 [Gonium pectorale]